MAGTADQARPAAEPAQAAVAPGRPEALAGAPQVQTCQQADITDFRFHDLRHTFNTNMCKAGVPQPVIMKMTGHKTAAMFHRYNTVDIDDGREALRKLEEYLLPERNLATGNPTTELAECSHSAPVNKNG